MIKRTLGFLAPFVVLMTVAYMARAQKPGEESLPFSAGDIKTIIGDGRTFEAISGLPQWWQFALDAKDEGMQQQWYSLTHDRASWSWIEVGKFWDAQMPRGLRWAGPRSQQDGLRYEGAAWYASSFWVPMSYNGQRIGLYVGAADESSWIYVNGQLAGTAFTEGIEGWNSPYVIDITPFIGFDRNNQVVIRVLNRAQAGGIHGKVGLVTIKGSGAAAAPVKSDPRLLRETMAEATPVRVPPHPGPFPAEQKRAPVPIAYRPAQRFPRLLKAGASLEFSFAASVGPVAVQVPCARVDFRGARLGCSINGSRLNSYPAFGGDTRYEKVAGKPGMAPPLARAEANWVVPPMWLKSQNKVRLVNHGPGEITLADIKVRTVGGDNLPSFQNSIYFDLSVWPQGWVWSSHQEFELAEFVLGLTNGAGRAIPFYLEPDIFNKKYPSMTRDATAVYPGDQQTHWFHAEELARQMLGWGKPRAEQHSVWLLWRASRDKWMKFVDADGNPETQAPKDYPVPNDWLNQYPKGADWVKYESAPYADTLDKATQADKEYATEYQTMLEQTLPFPAPALTARGYTPELAAEDWNQAMEAAAEKVKNINPRAQMEGVFSLTPEVRHSFYDTAVSRGHRLADSVDIIASHFAALAKPYDIDSLGRLITEGVDPTRRYPGGDYSFLSRGVLMEWIPEQAIEFNRYRLGRSDSDILPGLDKTKHRYSNGKSFDYRSGFDGDERMNVSEGTSYTVNPRSSYQWLYSYLSNSLLPSQNSEPRRFDFANYTINTFGSWHEGPFHTKRLRTRDPLYGDMFGYTGLQYSNSGDWPWLSGLLDPWHRRPGYDAAEYVRRTSIAFLAGGEAYPLRQNATSSDDLLIKSVRGVMDYKPFIAVYAVNFDTKPHRLDVSVPSPSRKAVAGMLLPEHSVSWMDREDKIFEPRNDEIRLTGTVKPGGVQQYVLFPETGAESGGLGVPNSPLLSGPPHEADLKNATVTLTWKPVPGARSYVVQLAAKPHFRRGSVLAETAVSAALLKPPLKLQPQRRYFWRVRSVDGRGRSSAYSPLRSFTVQWPEFKKFLLRYHEAINEGHRANGEALAILDDARARAQHFGLTRWDNPLQADGASYSASPAGSYQYEVGASWVTDGNWLSRWHSGKAALPARWSASFEKPTTLGHVRIYWGDEKSAGKDVDLMALSKGGEWRKIASVRGNTATVVIMQPEKPLAGIESLRLEIQSTTGGGEVAIREMRLFPTPFVADAAHKMAHVATGLSGD